MRKYLAAVAAFGFACGGGEPAAQDSQPAATAEPEVAAVVPVPAPAPAPATGVVHEIEMKLTSGGQYVFEPAVVAIKVGDAVRWLNVSGLPHNVAFYGDQIPAGAERFLMRQFEDDAAKLGPMASHLMTQTGEYLEITFTDAPTGSYGYFCTPHELLGMKAMLTIEQ